MFAGAHRRSSNVRVMQIFHELKSQFPTVPDHIVTAIASHVANGSRKDLQQLVAAAAAAKELNQMGRPSIQLETPPFVPDSVTKPPESVRRVDDMTDIASGDINRKYVGQGDDKIDTNDDKSATTTTTTTPTPTTPTTTISERKSDNYCVAAAKRPNSLNIKSDPNERRLQLSEKCKDVHKLLNSPILIDKPPRSPLSAKRFAAKKKDSTVSSPTSQCPPPPKKETVSTPTQTTDTLVNNGPIIAGPGLNLSLNVNCEMGLVQSPVKTAAAAAASSPRCTARVDITPAQPWLNPNPMPNDATSPRSFTSVNLTLRPPTSTPQDPIDITSQNSSLTYSTSSFDKERGLQSRLQITVGPGNVGSASSVRARPRSFHLGDATVETLPAKVASLTNITTVGSKEPLLLKQQARIDLLKIELQTGNARLIVLRQQVDELEKKHRRAQDKRTVAALETQLKKEIEHLRIQCLEAEKDEFYNNNYTDPAAPVPPVVVPQSREPPLMPRERILRPAVTTFDYQNRNDQNDRTQWNCSMCTFLNHGDIMRCETCEMPRVLHGTIRNNDRLTVDGPLRLPNPNCLDVLSVDDVKQSAETIRKSATKSSSSLSTNEMLKRLVGNEDNADALVRRRNRAFGDISNLPLASNQSGRAALQLPIGSGSTDA